MKHYRYILLDWDGNLAKTLDLWLEKLKQLQPTYVVDDFRDIITIVQ